MSWLKNRKVYVIFVNAKSNAFRVEVGEPQRSILTLRIFITDRADIISCVTSFSEHVFADNINVLIVSPVEEELFKMTEFIK